MDYSDLINDKKINDESEQKKIEKFATMLRTLNKYKKEYKSQTDEDEKKKIHGKIATYTQKWLDAKNLQLFNNIKFD